MSLSSLQKKMAATKSLLFIFLVGLFSLTFFVFVVKAAPVAPAGSTVTTTVLTAQTIQVGPLVSSTAGTGANWSFATSSDNVTRTVVNVTTATTTPTFIFTGLATNTPYYLAVAEGDGTATSSYITSTQVYTLADTPGIPLSVTSTNAQTLYIKINSSTNPTSTTYVVRDTASSTQTKYLQSNSTWSTTTATLTYVQLGGITGTTTVGLATNSLHVISVAAVNGAGVTTSYSSNATSTYTLAQTPDAPTVTSANPQRLTIVINPAGNPTTASTTFVIRDTVSSTQTKYLQSDNTWSTATATFNYSQLGGASGTTTIGLATSSPHIISVAAVNGDSSATTSYSSTVIVSTIPNTPTSSVSAAALTTITVSVNSSTNPTSTLYIVRDTGGSTVMYLQSDFTWSSTTTTLSLVFIGGLTTTITTGLSANTPHIVDVAAVSGDHTQTTTYGTSASLYTLANTPSSVSLSAGGNSFTLSWSGDANEQFWVDDLTAGTNSGWITGTSFSVSGVNCNTTHTFVVAGRNGDSVVTASSSQFTATTSGCGGGVSVGGGGGASVTPAQPAVPGVRPAIPAQVTLPASASSIAVFVHTLLPGTRGGEVKALQQKLRELGFFKHPSNTGSYGSVTRAAVRAFQKAHHIPQTGNVGPLTRAALNNL